MLTCEDDHGGKSEGNDCTAEEGGVAVTNFGGEFRGIFVLDKKIGAHEDKGAEHLDELCLLPALMLPDFEMREVTRIKNLGSIECIEDLEENPHAEETTRDLSNHHIQHLYREQACLILVLTDPVDPYAESDCWV